MSRLRDVGLDDRADRTPAQPATRESCEKIQTVTKYGGMGMCATAAVVIVTADPILGEHWLLEHYGWLWLWGPGSVRHTRDAGHNKIKILLSAQAEDSMRLERLGWLWEYLVCFSFSI